MPHNIPIDYDLLNAKIDSYVYENTHGAVTASHVAELFKNMNDLSNLQLVDWTTQKLNDATAIQAIDWGNRKMINASNQAAIDWSGANVLLYGGLSFTHELLPNGQAGNAGDVMKSNGAGAAPNWAALSSLINDSLIVSALGYTPENTGNKGVANGYTPLGSDGKIATTYLPSAILGDIKFKGTWNANTNIIASSDSSLNGNAIPAASSSNEGYYLIVSTSGSTNVSGNTDWVVGDWLVSIGTAWKKIDNTDLVTSVFGRVGAITANTGDYTAAQVTNAVDSTQSYSDPSWINALAWSKISGHPSTLAGYGITDALPSSYTPNWSAISGKPNTIAGYGITDAMSTALAAAKILVGSSLGVATARSPIGDISMDNVGNFTVGYVGGSTAALINAAELLANAATYLGTANTIVKRNSSNNFVGNLLDASNILAVDAANRKLKDSSNAMVIDFQNKLLSANGASAGVNWGTYRLQDTLGISLDWSGKYMTDSTSSYTSIDWGGRHLITMSSGSSGGFMRYAIDWGNYKAGDNSGVDSILWNTRLMQDAGGNTSIDWANRYLKDGSGINTVDWSNKQLKSGSYISVDWSGKTLRDTSNNLSASWASRYLYDSGGSIIAIDWSNRYLQNSAGVVNLDWQSKYLKTGGTTVMNWASQYLYDSTGTYVNIDWNGKTLKSAGLTTLDWANQTANSGGVIAVDWANRNLKNSSAGIVLDWTNLRLMDGSGNSNLDWSAKQLKASNTIMLDWSSTSGVALAQETASRALYLDASKRMKSSSVTATELSYLSGVTSAIQTQINALSGGGGGGTPNNTASTGVARNSSKQFAISQILDNSNGVRVDVDAERLISWYNGISIDWGQWQLLDYSQVQALNWNARIASDTSAQNSIDWAQRYLYDIGGNVTMDWNANTMSANAGYGGGLSISIDWQGRQLFDQYGVAVSEWGGYRNTFGIHNPNTLNIIHGNSLMIEDVYYDQNHYSPPTGLNDIGVNVGFKSASVNQLIGDSSKIYSNFAALGEPDWWQLVLDVKGNRGYTPVYWESSLP